MDTSRLSNTALTYKKVAISRTENGHKQTTKTNSTI